MRHYPRGHGDDATPQGLAQFVVQLANGGYVNDVVHGGGLPLSGAPGLTASPGAAASVRGCREEGEFSTTPHEDRLAREVAPLERKRIGVDADDDAFPPSVLHPGGRQHDAADADFVPALRSR